MPNFLIQECNVDAGDEFYRDLFSPMPQIEKGSLILPEAPGLGIELNDAEHGRIDFPAVLDDQEVYYCWELGEPEVGMWRLRNEDFDMRRSLAMPSAAGPTGGE